jgi:uncharacterized protein YfaS (alpha-2-macroglobulin family)
LQKIFDKVKGQAVYPTPLANMTQALARLIQDPNGCFEQTSSTTYPLVMAQQYFTTHTGIDPATIQKSNDILARGYKRLIGFECKGGGYEWFGQDPGHEARLGPSITAASSVSVVLTFLACRQKASFCGSIWAIDATRPP